MKRADLDSLQVKGEWLLIGPTKKDKTEGGILLPDSAKGERPTSGEVLKGGPDALTQVGSVVFFGEHRPVPIPFGNTTLLFMRDSDVMGLIPSDEDEERDGFCRDRFWGNCFKPERHDGRHKSQLGVEWENRRVEKANKNGLIKISLVSRLGRGVDLNDSLIRMKDLLKGDEFKIEGESGYTYIAKASPHLEANGVWGIQAERSLKEVSSG